MSVICDETERVDKRGKEDLMMGLFQERGRFWLFGWEKNKEWCAFLV